MAENKGGRPKKQIDQKEFEKLCFLQCTKQEFCSWFDTTLNGGEHNKCNYR